MYLKGEKSLHFSSCKYVREKVNLFPTLKTAQLCLSKSKLSFLKKMWSLT